MAGKHSEISPSNFERAELCAGSVALCATVPNVPNRWGAEGTLYHRFADLCMRYGFEPRDFSNIEEAVADGHRFDNDTITEAIGHLEDALDRIFEVCNENTLVLETRVDLSRWMPDQSGTLDLGWYNDRIIDIWDHKYGAGHPVFPKRNRQAMLYGLGFWNQIARHKTKATRFRFTIDQPRNHVGGGVWECDLDELLEFGKLARKVYDKAMKPRAPLVAGEKQCLFCQAKGICKEYQRFALETIQLKFDDLDADPRQEPDMGQMNMRRRAYLARHATFLKNWIDEQHALVLDAALKGHDTFGVKAIYGRKPKRFWSKGELKTIELTLADMLDHDQLYIEKMISPTQAEKLLSRKQLALVKDYIDQGDPKPTLVPVEDGREAIPPITEKFENLDRR